MLNSENSPSAQPRVQAFPAIQVHFLPFGSNPLVRGDVDGVCDGVMPDGQAEVSNGTRAVLLHQNILGFQVSVSNPRFS